jgi:hypothetical protein
MSFVISLKPELTHACFSGMLRLFRLCCAIAVPFRRAFVPQGRAAVCDPDNSAKKSYEFGPPVGNLLRRLA